MTRELAIKIINGDTLGTSEQTDEAVKMAIGALKNEEVQLKSMIEYLHNTGWLQEHIKSVVGQQWIPVSDHLPDKDFTDFLVQIGHGEYSLYETAYRVRGRWVFYSDRKDGEGQSVIAWMECPEPYTEEDQ